MAGGDFKNLESKVLALLAEYDKAGMPLEVVRIHKSDDALANKNAGINKKRDWTQEEIKKYSALKVEIDGMASKIHGKLKELTNARDKWNSYYQSLKEASEDLARRIEDKEGYRSDLDSSSISGLKK